MYKRQEISLSYKLEAVISFCICKTWLYIAPVSYTHLLKENYDYEVICCCVDCGQGEELDGLDERAKLSGATKLYIEDITDEFCDDYIVPCVQADAVDVYKRQAPYGLHLRRLL